MAVRDEILERKATIKENNQKIYDQGRQDEWSDFWDILQNKGKRTNYYYAFGSDTTPAPFNDDNFKPKYDICPTKAGRMFKCCNRITDLKDILEKQGVVLDFSNCDDVAFTFQNCEKLTRLPELNFSKCATITHVFTYCSNLISIDRIILSDNGTTTFQNAFHDNSDLENVAFEGVIGQDISFAYCSRLTKKSLTNIAEHLQDFSGEEGTDNLRTITFHNTIKTYLRDDPEGQVIGSLIASKRWGVM